MAQRHGADELEHARARNYHVPALVLVCALAAVSSCRPTQQAPPPLTDSAEALAKLDAELEDVDRKIATRIDTQDLGRALLLHSTRAELLGRTSDIEAALKIADRGVSARTNDPFALLARAHARTVAHLFRGAELDVQSAAQLGAEKSVIDHHRATIYAATGRFELALAAIESCGLRDSLHLAREGTVRSELGDLQRAEQVFQRAEHEYRDPSPFEIARVLVQHAELWERAGDDKRARALYETARAHVPKMFGAAVGLARMLAREGELEAAIEVIRPFANAEDPEAEALYAALLVDHGADASVIIAHADERYRALFAAHPELFADHAAQFWLRTGGQPKMALTAAMKNLDVHETREAFELALLCAIAARDEQAGCAIVARLRLRTELAQALAPLSAAAAEGCPAELQPPSRRPRL